MTIKDLSAQTGYSVGTISRALNNQPNVSEKARSVILKAAAESGFQLNANAKQLKQQHSNSILVLAKGSSNELFGALIEAMQARMSKTNYPLIVDYNEGTINEVRHAIQLCIEKKPLGVLFLGGNREHFLADFDKIKVPSVLVTNDATGLPFDNLSSVAPNNIQAAEMAIDHLVSLGHRKIAVIGSNRKHSDTTNLRWEGCMRAFDRHNISFDPERDYASVQYTFAGGYLGAQQLLESGRDFTAIFAMSDVMAIGAIRALRDAGKLVPEDISVIGFDGLNLGEYTVPKLSTICQPIEELAERSIRMLMENIEFNQGPRYEIIPVELIQKESTREI